MMGEKDKVCPICKGARWICEVHPDKPWPHDNCEESGEPCFICNTGDPPVSPIGIVPQ